MEGELGRLAGALHDALDHVCRQRPTTVIQPTAGDPICSEQTIGDLTC
jgi:hypothetical protein